MYLESNLLSMHCHGAFSYRIEKETLMGICAIRYRILNEFGINVASGKSGKKNYLNPLINKAPRKKDKSSPLKLT